VDYKQAQDKYTRLKTRLQQKKISLADFEKAVYSLSVTDLSGVEWQIGPSTGKWYCFSGGAWIEAIPDKAAALSAAEAPGGISGQVWTALALVLVILIVGAGYAMFHRAIDLSEVIPPTSPPVPSPLAIVETLPAQLVVPGSEPATSKTPSPVKTVVVPSSEPTASQSVKAGTPAPATSTPLPTITATSAFQTIIPTVPGDLVPVHNWQNISQSDFSSDPGVLSEWRFIFDIASTFAFTNFSGMLGLHVTMNANYVDISPQDNTLIDTLKDVEMEEVFAFPAGNDVSSVNLVCRMQDLTNYYALVVRRTSWQLITKVNDEDTELASGSTPSEFQKGAWGHVRLRCQDNLLKAWFNDIEIANKTSPAYATGTWAVVLMMDDNATEYDLYYLSHRVWELRDDDRPDLYGAEEAGDFMFIYDSDMVLSGTTGRLGMVLLNRSSNPIIINASQVYLERKDGKKFPVSASNSPAGVANFPYTVLPARSEIDFTFPNISASDIHTGLSLVIDLSSNGLGQMRFYVSG
jgi:hypothetical protein